MKRLLCLALTFVFCIGLISAPVSADDYVTYKVVITNNKNGTVTINAYAPAGIYSGKLVLDTTDDLTYVSATAPSPCMLNENYNKNGITGVCVVFAYAVQLQAETLIYTGQYSVSEGATIDADDVFSYEWNLTNGDMYVGSQNDGGVNVIETFAVNFYNSDDSLCEQQIVEYGKSAVAPTDYDFYLEGYNFIGWSEDFSYVTSDLHVYPVFEAKTYTVTFIGHNGEVIGTDIVEYCYPATAPVAPAVEGYTFTGWDKNFSNVRDDITVTAIYTINTYTVTFEAAEGGTITGNKSITVDYGTSVDSLAFPEVTAGKGYVFDKWEYTSDIVTGDITVTAVFTEAPPYTLGDVNNDGYIDNMDAAVILKYDSAIIDEGEYILNAGDVNKDGYIDNMDAAMILKYDAGIIEGF